MIRIAHLLLVIAAPAVAIDFSTLPMPGLEVGPVNPLTAQPMVNFRHADLNADGRLDLILPTGVYIADETGYTPASPLPPPPVHNAAMADVWKDRVYVLDADSWRMLRWHDDAWVEEYRHPQTRGAEYAARVGTAADPGLRWTRFLYDFNADGQPEAVLVRDDGVRIIQVNPDGVTELAVLNVLPAMQLARVPNQALWPSSERRLAYPSQHLDCRLVIDASAITVITRDHTADGRIRYRVMPYRIDTTVWSAFADDRNALLTPPMPAYMQPCRLNGDGVLDFAGGDWEFSSTRLLPVPIHVTAASTDGGATIQTVRTQSYSPLTMFVDFDGDDRLDIVTDSTGLFRGGLRESLNRFASNRSIDHQVQVYPQATDGTFAETPSFMASFRVELLRAPRQHGDMFRRYQSSELFNVTGDFNDDARKDFVVRLRSGRLEVYLSGQEGVAKKADAVVLVDAPMWRFAVADVNGDEVSDIVIVPAGDAPPVVYLTRRAPL